jgi:hypothetical protein
LLGARLSHHSLSILTQSSSHTNMVGYYDELEIEDFAWDPVANVFHYPCPCGDRFEISKSQLRDGEEIAICPSCSLIVRVIYDYVSVAGLVISLIADGLGRLRIER